MKRIIGVSASLRNGSNSEFLLDQVLQGAKESGNEVEKVSLKNKNILFCKGCLACQKTGHCFQKDDIEPLLDKVQEADVLILATPIYYYSMAGQLKTFLDRMNPLFPKKNNFKDIYLVATCADSEKEAVDVAAKEVEGWASCFPGATLKKIIYGTSLTGTGEAKDSLASKEAYALGKEIR